MVLVFQTKLLKSIGEFQGYTLNLQEYLYTFLYPENCQFIDRDMAEHDDRYKQLIPYVVLRYRNSVFSYVRGKKSSETRLLALRSIGIGGHIEPVDQSLFTSNHELYVEAANREVREEVELCSTYTEHLVALINDDSTEVGKVHLGIMHIWDLAEPKVKKREGLITEAGFVPLEKLKSQFAELETWSQIALQVLEDPHVPQYISIPPDTSEPTASGSSQTPTHPRRSNRS